MVRTIIKIDEEKCNGCEGCVNACHENAIVMQNGKAVLLRDDYCDGLGHCLPSCPTGAISFEEREAADFDEAAVNENMLKTNALKALNAHVEEPVMVEDLPLGCPGKNSKAIQRPKEEPQDIGFSKPSSQLNQWPVQIKLVPVNAPYFDNANLLIAADCTAFSYGNFHNEFIRNRITLIGCPKLDEGDYTEKLTAIIKTNNLKSLTVVRMEVPCCGGIENAVKNALQASGKFIPWQVVVISTDGKILEL